MTLAYRVKDGLYLNITNQCCCACTFCIRQDHQGVGDGDNLWLEREPTAKEIIDALGGFDLKEYREAVFCGYGEPTQKLDVMLEVCRHLRQAAPELPIRLNTNGLSDRINGRETAPLLEGLVDVVSVSLNAPDADRYFQLVRPSFGRESFDAMLRFAQSCKAWVPDVQFTVVDLLEPQVLEQCRELADSLGIPLRVRAMI